MKSWSKRLTFVVAALTVSWLGGIGFATSQPKPSTPSSITPLARQGQTMAPGTSLPASLRSAFAQTAGGTQAPAGRAQAPAPAGRAQAPAAAPKPGTSDAVFKNIQVLKGLPIDEFMGTMGVFTT